MITTCITHTHTCLCVVSRKPSTVNVARKAAYDRLHRRYGVIDLWPESSLAAYRLAYPQVGVDRLPNGRYFSGSTAASSLARSLAGVSSGVVATDACHQVSESASTTSATTASNSDTSSTVDKPI
jgi:hypothetical protein